MRERSKYTLARPILFDRVKSQLGMTQRNVLA